MQTKSNLLNIRINKEEDLFLQRFVHNFQINAILIKKNTKYIKKEHDIYLLNDCRGTFQHCLDIVHLGYLQFIITSINRLEKNSDNQTPSTQTD